MIQYLLVYKMKGNFLKKGGIHMNKIPQITLIFWIMKISATTLGETAGDLFSITLNIGYSISSIIFIGFFLISLMSQLISKKYYPLLFWAVILSTSMAGTTMSDYIDRTLKLGYANGSIILISLLIAILGLWYWSEQSLNVNRIQTRKAEVFYWFAILLSNTLGTAFGDFLTSSGLGFVGGAILIGGVLGLLVLAIYYTKISHVLVFWIAFILTRPFGATFGDLLTKSHAKGGLDLGTLGSSLVLITILFCFIVYDTLKNVKWNVSSDQEPVIEGQSSNSI